MDRACVLTRALGRMARVDRQSRSGSGARGPLRVTLRLAGTPERWISREATNKFGTTDQLSTGVFQVPTDRPNPRLGSRKGAYSGYHAAPNGKPECKLLDVR